MSIVGAVARPVVQPGAESVVGSDGATPDQVVSNLELESGDDLLLEDGGFLVLE